MGLGDSDFFFCNQALKFILFGFAGLAAQGLLTLQLQGQQEPFIRSADPKPRTAYDLRGGLCFGAPFPPNPLQRVGFRI